MRPRYALRFCAVLALAAASARAQPVGFLVNDNRENGVLVSQNPRICDVDATLAGEQCTLEAALFLASGGSGTVADEGATIGFELAPGAHVINLRTRYVFNRRVIIDGTTQPGYAGRPVITINVFPSDGSSTPFLSFNGAASAVRGLAFSYVTETAVALNGGLSRVEGCYVGLNASGAPLGTGIAVGSGILVNSDGNIVGGAGSLRNVVARRGGTISGLTGHGIVVYGNGNRIENNVVGMNPDGTTALPNNGSGIVLTYGATGNVVTGNLIAGNRDAGVLVSGGLPGRIASGNRIENNVIGLNAAGTAIPTGAAFSAFQSGVLVLGGADGGTATGTIVGPGNTISGNRVGVWIDVRTSATQVVGNVLGLNRAGTALVANTFAGVHVTGGGVAARIGGASDAHRNVIAGGSYGVVLANPSSSFDTPGDAPNVVSGNWIGLNAAGTAALGGTTGILVARADDVIGADTTVGRGNVIAGMTLDGILLGRLARANRVYGNRVGTRPDGLAAIPNGGNGVAVSGSGGHRIGGTAPWQRNVLSGNAGRGLLVEMLGIPGATTAGTRIEGNVVGVGADGTTAVANGSSGTAGIELRSGVTGVTIGGAALGAGNVVARNPVGVSLQNASDVSVHGNRIGIDATGAPAPNGVGVSVSNGQNVRVGGTGAGEGNTIQQNRFAGVQVSGAASAVSSRVAILSNAFGGNGAQGIDLRVTNDGAAEAERTLNDAGDADEGFANRAMNYPVVRSARLESSTGTLTVTYRLETPVGAVADYPVRVQVYAADGNPPEANEGTVLLGTDVFEAADWAAGGTRVAVFRVSPELFSGGSLIATATDAAGHTSEFSDAVKINTGTVAVEGGPSMPTAWALGAAAPNPTRGASALTVDAPVAGRVRVVAVDALGREVAVLLDADVAAGRHRADVPSGWAPGLYLVRLTAPGVTATQRLVVVR